MKRISCSLLSFLAILILLPGHPLRGADPHPLTTVQRTIHSHAWGDRTYTSLVIDGGVVPLIVPPMGGATVQGGDGATVTWDKDHASAHFRTATPAEAALADLMGKPEAAEAWKKQIVSTLRGPGFTWKVNDFQPDILDVNHWRIGAITMDFTIGGRACGSLLMIWRCRDGSTIAVTMQCDAPLFKAHCDQLSSMISSALLLPP